jgi:hypothetical protein
MARHCPDKTHSGINIVTAGKMNTAIGEVGEDRTISILYYHRLSEKRIFRIAAGC